MPNTRSTIAERFARTRYWDDSRSFTAADMCGAVNENVSTVRHALEQLVDAGQLEKSRERGTMFYRRKRINMASVNWRHNPDVYKEIAEENLSYLQGEVHARAPRTACLLNGVRPHPREGIERESP